MKTIYWFVYMALKSTAKAFFGYRVIGEEKLVQDGGVLIASNHESFLDPPLIGFAYEGEISYLARKTLFRGPAAWLYPRLNAVPVNQEEPDMSSLKRIIKTIRSGKRVLVFPEGARTEDGHLQPAAAGVGLIASKSQSIIQPVRIFGARKCLPRGSSKLRFHPITIVIGDPLTLTPQELKAKGRDEYQAISNRIMAEIAKLKLPVR